MSFFAHFVTAPFFGATYRIRTNDPLITKNNIIKLVDSTA